MSLKIFQGILSLFLDKDFLESEDGGVSLLEREFGEFVSLS
jgi:hypothetical protein